MNVDLSPREQSQTATPARRRPSVPFAAAGTARGCYKRSTVPPGAPAPDAGSAETAAAAAVVSGASVPRGVEHGARGPGIRLVVVAAAA